jgi:hypothetical protein
VGESKKFFIFFFGSTYILKINHIGRPNNSLIPKDLMTLKAVNCPNTASNMRQYDQKFARSGMRGWWDAPVGAC